MDLRRYRRNAATKPRGFGPGGGIAVLPWTGRTGRWPGSGNTFIWSVSFMFSFWERIAPKSTEVAIPPAADAVGFLATFL
jgi:hypothetical protein